MCLMLRVCVVFRVYLSSSYALRRAATCDPSGSGHGSAAGWPAAAASSRSGPGRSAGSWTGTPPAGRRGPGRPRGPRPERRGRALVRHAVQDVHAGAEAERALPGDRVHERAAQGEHVGGAVGAARPQVLRGHEGGRADPLADGGQHAGVAGLGDAEVDDVGTLHGQDHVRRLQVAVHDAGRGQVTQGARQVGEQPPGRLPAQCAVVGQGLREVDAREVVGGHPQEVVVEAAALQPRGVRGVHTGLYGRLACEAPPELGVACVLRPDDLDGREVRPPVGRAGQEDLAHTPAAEFPYGHVRPDSPGIARLERRRPGMPQYSV